MRVKRILSQGPQGRTILDYRYAYDRMDNITTKQTEHGAYRYAYDDLYRLTQAENPTLPDEAFTYDPVGNRLTAKNVEGMWSYNPNNELEEYDAVSFRYDANGNTVEKVTPSGVSRYGYNAEDRMARVEDETGDLIATYAYDPFGRRLWKDVAGEKVFFLYSDEGLIAEFDGRGKEIKTYGYKPGSTWTTDPVFMKHKGKYFFYHNDHLGMPQKITAADGVIVWLAQYLSFGVTRIGVESVESNMRFPGQYYDKETVLHYNWYRYYFSQLGRYLRVDPIGLEGGINPLTYTKNNPNVSIDPQGLITIEGMSCDETNRKRISVISSSEPLFKINYGSRVICTDIVIEDTFSCVCIGKKEKIIQEAYKIDICYEVRYNCCDSEARSKVIIKIECDESINFQYDYISTNQTVIRHGTASAAFGGCSECLAGVGRPM